MVRSSAVTKLAILDAAVDEFAQAGFAGARVDRIAEASGVNKRMIYVYYGDKERLFVAALHLVLDQMMREVPVTEDDLPGYAGALFDYLVANPHALRFTMWRHLERPDAGPEVRELYAAKVAAIASGSSSTTYDGTDLLVLVQGMAGAWLMSPLDLLSAVTDEPMSPARLAAHRAALTAAVSQLVSTPSPRP